MITLNAGNLWEDRYLDKVIALNKEYKGIQVTSLFGSIGGLTPTARATDRLPYRDWDFIAKYTEKAQEAGIAIRYTLNASCIGSLQGFDRDWHSNLTYTCQKLHDLGIRQWTVTSPLLCELIVRLFPNHFVEVSTIAEVATPEEWKRWESLGAYGACLSTSINRDFQALKMMTRGEPGGYFSILANEACLYRCPWRRDCYNLSSHNSIRSSELFDRYSFSRCQRTRYANPIEWVKSRMVLPQWMKEYTQLTGISNFKVAFRTHPYEVAVPILEAYMKQEYTGNLINLWPSVAPYAGMEEPKDVISCKRLDDYKFLDYFVGNGHKCKDNVCGLSCLFCVGAYDYAKI